MCFEPIQSNRIKAATTMTTTTTTAPIRRAQHRQQAAAATSGEHRPRRSRRRPRRGRTRKVARQRLESPIVARSWSSWLSRRDVVVSHTKDERQKRSRRVDVRSGDRRAAGGGVRLHTFILAAATTARRHCSSSSPLVSVAARSHRHAFRHSRARAAAPIVATIK